MNELVRTLFTWKTAVAITGLTIVFVGLLWLEGRPWWCKSGFGIWSAAWTNCTSQHFLDPYSLSHVLHGVIFFWLLWPFADRVSFPWRLVASIGLEIGWEIFENSAWVIARYRQDTAAFDYTGDSIINALGDVVAATIGFVIASRISWRGSIALFVAFELWMLWLAHDNLTLNIVMLLYPFEGIKEWQLSGLRLPISP